MDELPVSSLGYTVSIAVCSRNRAGELRRLATLLRYMTAAVQDTDVELVIVEDVSEMAQAERPQPIQQADVYYAVTAPHRGFGAIRQQAVEIAKGDVIVFIDDDCIPCPDWLPRLLEPFSDPQVAAVGGGILPQHGGPVAKAIALIGLPAGGLPRLVTSGPQASESEHLSTGNLALRRASVLAAGGFDTRYRFGGEDQQLVGKLSGKKLFVPAALVRHRNRESFPEVWGWFSRRGMGEYHVNRIEGMGRMRALWSPLR